MKMKKMVGLFLIVAVLATLTMAGHYPQTADPVKILLDVKEYVSIELKEPATRDGSGRGIVTLEFDPAQHWNQNENRTRDRISGCSDNATFFLTSNYNGNVILTGDWVSNGYDNNIIYKENASNLLTVAADIDFNDYVKKDNSNSSNQFDVEFSLVNGWGKVNNGNNAGFENWEDIPAGIGQQNRNLIYTLTVATGS